MAKKKTEPKPRAEKYETKLAINGTLEDLLKASFLGKSPVKKEEK